MTREQFEALLLEINMRIAVLQTQRDLEAAKAKP